MYLILKDLKQLGLHCELQGEIPPQILYIRMLDYSIYIVTITVWPWPRLSVHRLMMRTCCWNIWQQKTRSVTEKGTMPNSGREKVGCNWHFWDKVYFTGLHIYGHNSLNFTCFRTTITLLYRGEMWFHHIQKWQIFFKNKSSISTSKNYINVIDAYF